MGMVFFKRFVNFGRILTWKKIIGTVKALTKEEGQIFV
jgi:hypothetical protein